VASASARQVRYLQPVSAAGQLERGVVRGAVVSAQALKFHIFAAGSMNDGVIQELAAFSVEGHGQSCHSGVFLLALMSTIMRVARGVGAGESHPALCPVLSGSSRLSPRSRFCLLCLLPVPGSERKGGPQASAALMRPQRASYN